MPRIATADRVSFGNTIKKERCITRALKLGEGGTVVVFRHDPATWDGRFANNAWLQEMPDPITKMVWDNAAIISAVGLSRGLPRRAVTISAGWLARAGRGVVGAAGTHTGVSTGVLDAGTTVTVTAGPLARTLGRLTTDVEGALSSTLEAAR